MITDTYNAARDAAAAAYAAYLAHADADAFAAAFASHADAEASYAAYLDLETVPDSDRQAMDEASALIAARADAYLAALDACLEAN